MSDLRHNDPPFRYRYSPYYGFGVVTTLLAYGLAFWPMDPGALTARLLTVAGLLFASCIALYHDLETRTLLARLQWWANTLFVVGMICLPLKAGGKLPWYVAAASVSSLVGALYLNWRVQQEKKRVTVEVPVPPRD